MEALAPVQGSKITTSRAPYIEATVPTPSGGWPSYRV